MDQDQLRTLFEQVRAGAVDIEAAMGRMRHMPFEDLVFADPDSGERPHLKDASPDPYSIRHIGYEKYVEAYRVYPQERSDEIARHAGGIAWKLQGCDPLARVLVVVSLNLLDPV